MTVEIVNILKDEYEKLKIQANKDLFEQLVKSLKQSNQNEVVNLLANYIFQLTFLFFSAIFFRNLGRNP